MKKKIVLRIFVILIPIILLFIYFSLTNEKKVVEKEPLEPAEKTVESSNIIKDVSYTSKDASGNEYYLEAEEGIIDQNKSDIIFLTNVKAVINLKNYEVVEIYSNFGKYNINNYDTIFSKNVIITYLENEIKGNYLDFSWEKNLMTISKGVNIKNKESSLIADVIEINLKTKDVKIFMYEENKKVNIKTLK